MGEAGTENRRLCYVGTDDVHMRIPLLLALRDRGFEVCAVGSERGDDFDAHSIPYWRYGLKRRLGPVADLRAAVQLYSIFRRQRPDIVHAFDTKPTILAPWLAHGAGVRGIVRTVTGLGYVFSTDSMLTLSLRPIYRFFQRISGSWTDVTIFQNADDREYFLKQGLVHTERHALVAGSGIDRGRLLRRVPGADGLSRLRDELGLEDDVVVTMISRLVKTKGVPEYLEAARIVRESLANVRFLLIGPMSSEGRRAISSRALDEAGDVVRYLGKRGDVPALLALTDVFVHPSYYREGVPRVLLEAGAMGLPLVTTDMPGCREAVRDGWNGILVPPRKSVPLAEAILRLARSSYLRQEMGARNREHIARFDLQRVADEYAELYTRVFASDRFRGEHRDSGQHTAPYTRT